MAKQIVILESNKDQTGSTVVRYLFWIPIAVGREVPRPTATSQFRNADSAEIAAIQAGQVIEEIYDQTYVAGKTNNQIKADLLERYTARAAFIAALPNVNQFYGIFYNGTAWSA